MSRLPAALVVCGVCILALSPSGHAFPAGNLNLVDAPRPVLLVAHENKKPHGDADSAQNLEKLAKDLMKRAKDLEKRAKDLEKRARDMEMRAKEESAGQEVSAEEKSAGDADKSAGSSGKDSPNKSAETAKSPGGDDADDRKPGRPSPEKLESGTAGIEQDKPAAAPAKKSVDKAVPSSTTAKPSAAHGKPLGLPFRKPRKPIVRKPADNKKANQQNTQPRSARDKKLCKALQACRNVFTSCKSKIKYPDQSEAWSIAKEKCGAEYKVCVEKDFRKGEWFFTRWFYFQELDCK